MSLALISSSSMAMPTTSNENDWVPVKQRASPLCQSPFNVNFKPDNMTWLFSKPGTFRTASDCHTITWVYSLSLFGINKSVCLNNTVSRHLMNKNEETKAGDYIMCDL